MSAMRADLLGVGEAVRDPHAHHELAGRLAPEEHAGPLQPLAVALVDRLPAVLRRARGTSGTMSSPSFSCLSRSILFSVTTTSPVGRLGARGVLGAAAGVVEQRPASRGPGRRARRCAPLPAGTSRSRCTARVASHTALQAARAAEHGLDDLRLRHAVAVADLRGVGNLLAARPAADRSATRKQQLRRDRPASGVDSANACEQRGTIAPSPIDDRADEPVVADDQLLVDAARRLRVADDLVVVFDGSLSPMTASVDARHLQLGRRPRARVDARRRSGRSADRRAPAPAPTAARPDRTPGRDARRTRRPRRRPARRGTRGRRRRRCRARPSRPALPRELHVRPDAGGDDHHVARRASSRREGEAGDVARRRARRSSPCLEMDVQAHLLELPPQDAPPARSSCASIRCGIRWTTWTSRPWFSRPRAASRPSSPPPMTAARRDALARSAACDRSRRACGTRTTPSLEASPLVACDEPVDRRHERPAAGGETSAS